MVDAKMVEIDGVRFQIVPMEPLKALAMDREFTVMAGLGLKGLEGVSFENLGSGELELDKVVDGLVAAVTRLGREAFMAFVLDMLHGVVVAPIGKPPKEISDSPSFNEAFTGYPPMLIYKTMYHVAKENHFTPFELIGHGGVMGKIRTLLDPTEGADSSGLSLEKSGTPLSGSTENGPTGD